MDADSLFSWLHWMKATLTSLSLEVLGHQSYSIGWFPNHHYFRIGLYHHPKGTTIFEMVVDDSRVKLKIQLLQSSSVCGPSNGGETIFQPWCPALYDLQARSQLEEPGCVVGFHFFFKFNTLPETNISHFSPPGFSKVGRWLILISFRSGYFSGANVKLFVSGTS